MPEAAGAEEGEVAFNVTEVGIDPRLATAASKGRRVDVKMTTLDVFIERQGLDRGDLVRMDIEGAEELALRGADRLIERLPPSLDGCLLPHRSLGRSATSQARRASGRAGLCPGGRGREAHLRVAAPATTDGRMAQLGKGHQAGFHRHLTSCRS